MFQMRMILWQLPLTKHKLLVGIIPLAEMPWRSKLNDAKKNTIKRIFSKYEKQFSVFFPFKFQNLLRIKIFLYLDGFIK